MVKIKINNFFSNISSNDVKAIITAFMKSDELIGNQNRNLIKRVVYNNLSLNVKSFKVPNIINQVVYGYNIRKSKAARSFEYANKLLSLNIGTPKPLAYIENRGFLGLRNSYYISEHLNYDLTYRELVTDLNYPNHESLLRAFTRFTYCLHEKGVYFLDHSPGNTLIVLNEGEYNFYLVDLNRMKFQSLSFSDRMGNFSRLTQNADMVAVMSDEYAKVSGLEYAKVYSEMWKLTQGFHEKYHRRRRLKKKILMRK